MRPIHSISEQNVYQTYVCLINDITPSSTRKKSGYKSCAISKDASEESRDQEEEPIKVGRSKALHELVEAHRKVTGGFGFEEHENKPGQSNHPVAISESVTNVNENEENNFLGYDNPNILKLTKMKWLTEGRDGAPDSSSSSLSPSSSTTSSCSEMENLNKTLSTTDKYLSTIIQLDKEHNMFGLSNITIVGRPSKKLKKEEEKPVFPQTAIVQVCCSANCCRHKSNTDLPASLRCGGCRGYCFDPSCPTCLGICPSVCSNTPVCPPCSSCPTGQCSCKVQCAPTKCLRDCSACFGLKITLNRKPKFEPSPIEITPRSSSVLQKPLAARSCHHLPQCVPPSSCFPYFMPCYWPARSGAPCSCPARCFHNPPCPAPRRPKSMISPEEMCSSCGSPDNDSKNNKCPNIMCPGNNPALKKEIENRYGKK